MKNWYRIPLDCKDNLPRYRSCLNYSQGQRKTSNLNADTQPETDRLNAGIITRDRDGQHPVYRLVKLRHNTELQPGTEKDIQTQC